MRKTIKLGLTALVAALLLSAAIGTASARNFSVNREGIRVTWSSLEFRFNEAVQFRCRITLEGSFHRRTVPKTLGSLIGIVTRAAIDSSHCVGGTFTAARLPWHLTYEGFTGNLPSITSIRLSLREYLFTISRLAGGGTTCSYGTATDRIVFSASLSGGTLTTLRPTEASQLTLLEDRSEIFIPCPLQGTAVSEPPDGQMVSLNSTNRIVVTLI